MSFLPFEWAQYDFMLQALLALIIIVPLLSTLGCMVVNSQMAFFSDAIGHASLTGIALSLLAGLKTPLWGMLLFSCFLALAITILKRYSRTSIDTLIGIIMAFSVSLGIVLITRVSNFNKFTSFLIGDILSITHQEIYLALIVLALFLIIWPIVFNRILFVSLHRTLARSRGIHTFFYELTLALFIAVVVSISISWVGLLVINSLLILPAASARNIAKNIPSYILLSVLIGIICAITGLILSFYLSTATGATIVLVLMTVFIFTTIFKKI